jgi:hypothetical protein
MELAEREQRLPDRLGGLAGVAAAEPLDRLFPNPSLEPDPDRPVADRRGSSPIPANTFGQNTSNASSVVLFAPPIRRATAPRR